MPTSTPIMRKDLRWAHWSALSPNSPDTQRGSRTSAPLENMPQSRVVETMTPMRRRAKLLVAAVGFSSGCL